MTRFMGTAALAMLLTAGCAEGDERAEQLESPEPVTTSTPAAVAIDTTPQALWAHLQAENYRSWPLFPGTGELYAGGEPHGMLLTTHVNRLAHDALTNHASVLPDGAILVKENYLPDSTYAGATVMHKVTGFDPANGDWYWAKFEPDGSVEDAGRAPMCQQCHSAGRDRDFVMTPLPGNPTQ
jgi:hypothetical protein